MLKLDIGSGNLEDREKGVGLACQLPLDDWVHLDIQPGKHVELVCDFGSIPYDDGTVDEIFLGDVLEHVPPWRLDAVLNEWCRVLKPGGLIFGRTPNLDRIHDYIEGWIDLDTLLGILYGKATDQWQVHYTCYTKERLCAVFETHGFTDVSLRNSPGPRDRPWWWVFSAVKR